MTSLPPRELEGAPMGAGEDVGVTANAILLLGYLAGAISRGESDPYEVTEVAAGEGWMVVRHRDTGNTYRVAVAQLTGMA